MTDDQSRHLQYLAQVYSARHYSIDDRLSQSLTPRQPDMLFDIAGEYLSPDARMLDVGCRDAGHLVRLSQQHGCAGTGIDPLQWHVQQGVEQVAAAGLTDRLAVVRGRMEQLPFADETFDFVWSRDMLALVDDLDGGMAEAARVLRPGGHMLVYTLFATERLEPREAAMLCNGLGNVLEHMQQPRVEQSFRSAQLDIDRTDVVSTEWREYEEERTRPASDDLLKLARLRRDRDAVTAEYGERIFTMAEASLHWLTYILVGKLLPVMYVLRKPDADESRT